MTSTISEVRDSEGGTSIDQFQIPAGARLLVRVPALRTASPVRASPPDRHASSFGSQLVPKRRTGKQPADRTVDSVVARAT